MAGVSTTCSIFVAVFIVIVTANDECTYIKDTLDGCTVDKGHAVCESKDMPTCVRGIPACATWVTLSLQNLDLTIARSQDWNLIFDSLESLPQLKKLSIAVNRENYESIPLVWLGNQNTTLNFPNLEILQLNADTGGGEINEDTWRSESLQVLDFSRSKVGIVNAKRLCKTLPVVQKLVLRNIQTIKDYAAYIPSLNLTDFVCIGNVRYLDLSYNDLTSIRIANMCWNIKLQVINLDHNMLANIKTPDRRFSKVLSILQVIPRLKTLNINYCSSTTQYHKGLWDEDENRTDLTGLQNENENTGYCSESNLVDKIIHTPFSLFAGYGNWLCNMMKHCGNIRYSNLAKCTIKHGSADACQFLHCISPDFSIKACQEDKADRAYEKFSRQFCDYPACLYNIQFPLPQSLTKISMRESGEYVDDSPRHWTAVQHPNESVCCFDPSNKLEVIDFTDAILNDIDHTVGQKIIHGLKKLKFLSLQGCGISYVINPLLFSDMESLEEVHIGGNRLFANDSLPAVTFQSNIKLSILNLSYSHLQSIEPDAFINNKHLAVLDLSHNHLDASSLAALDLSDNNIKHLNLSFNALKTLPSTVRYHFDQFHDLVLDLSGNNFLCNCQHLGFLQWIQSNAAITFVYAGDHVCYDSPGNTIHNIEVDSLYCNWYWEQPAVAVGCSLLLFLFFLTIFVLYRKRWFIRNLVFRLQERLSHSDSDTHGTSYKYDAFVLYSSIDADRLWVHYKLRSELENVFGFRLCIHHRDFPPGLDIIDNIEDAIRSSRKVLVIISENFVNSDWCVEEVNMTMSVDRSKFIVIMYSDVMLSPVRIPTVIRWLLETRTYIEWAEDAQAQELFWKKLRRALYTKNRVTRQEESQANVESDSQVINLIPSGNILT